MADKTLKPYVIVNKKSGNIISKAVQDVEFLPVFQNIKDAEKAIKTSDRVNKNDYKAVPLTAFDF